MVNCFLFWTFVAECGQVPALLAAGEDGILDASGVVADDRGFTTSLEGNLLHLRLAVVPARDAGNHLPGHLAAPPVALIDSSLDAWFRATAGGPNRK